MNQTQGPTVATISTDPRTEDVGIAIVTCRGAMTREDEPHPQVRLSRKKKIAFDIATEKEIVFGARDAIEINLGKSPVYEMPFAFNY